jgi:hypothetical protein
LPRLRARRKKSVIAVIACAAQTRITPKPSPWIPPAVSFDCRRLLAARRHLRDTQVCGFPNLFNQAVRQQRAAASPVASAMI